MSAIQLGGVSGSSGTPDAFGSLGSEEFLKIILTELTSQDPLSPNDTSALLDQISTIRSIESDIALGDRLDAIVTENQLTSAASMIGKFVSGYAEGWGNVTGFVVAALRQGDSVAIELDTGWIVPLQNVEVVLEPDAIPGGPETPEEPEEPVTPEEPETPADNLGNSGASAQPLPPQVGQGPPPG
ncbi:MAG: hypothetical protein CMJ28_02715, partial [Phycisphaerae bacterium]|nr:hypothetical protein [Phycisphaerae bacterium]